MLHIIIMNNLWKTFFLHKRWLLFILMLLLKFHLEGTQKVNFWCYKLAMIHYTLHLYKIMLLCVPFLLVIILIKNFLYVSQQARSKWQQVYWPLFVITSARACCWNTQFLLNRHSTKKTIMEWTWWISVVFTSAGSFLGWFLIKSWKSVGWKRFSRCLRTKTVRASTSSTSPASRSTTGSSAGARRTRTSLRCWSRRRCSSASSSPRAWASAGPRGSRCSTTCQRASWRTTARWSTWLRTATLCSSARQPVFASSSRSSRTWLATTTSALVLGCELFWIIFDFLLNFEALDSYKSVANHVK